MTAFQSFSNTYSLGESEIEKSQVHPFPTYILTEMEIPKMKKIILLMTILLSACTPEVDTKAMEQFNPSKICLEGVNYWVAALQRHEPYVGYGHGFMAVVIDKDTLKPERCVVVQ